MKAVNARYLAFMAAIDNPEVGLNALDKMAKTARDKDRSYRGFNVFLATASSWRLSGIVARLSWIFRVRA